MFQMTWGDIIEEGVGPYHPRNENEDSSTSGLVQSQNELEQQLETEKAEDSVEWILVCIEEINLINKTKTWILVDKPAGVQVFGLKWVFKIKRSTDGTMNNFKARLVAGEDKCAYILTKALARIKFTEMRKLLGVRDMNNTELKLKRENFRQASIAWSISFH